FVETIVECFERQAILSAQRIAVSSSSTRLTYRDLNLCANRIARAIVGATEAHTDETSSPVALLMDKDAPLIAAILGTLKAGCLCVPLDCSFPEARTRFVLEDAGAKLLVTDTANLEAARRLAGSGVVVLNVEELPLADNARNLDLEIDPNSVACLIYTSGSTGQPKGVADTHRNVLHHVRRYTQALHFGPDDRIALLASCSVGQGIKTVWSALLNGATICPFDVKTKSLEALASWMSDERITVFISVPSLFRQFARQSSTRNAFPDLRLIRLGGETLHRQDVELFRERFSPQCLLANSFSSTETGNVALFLISETTPLSGDTVPVGFIAEGTEVLLLDENNREVGLDEVGEIVVRSCHLSPGYWRKPELTEQVFQAGRHENERLYRTGDLGSMSSDGCLQHRGRRDFQVKIRGFRVELGEVEATLKTHGAIRETVVAARPDARGENCLVAYVVAENPTEITPKKLRRFLTERLPQHAIPSFYVQLEALPLTPNGKIDHAQLPSPQVNQAPRSDEDAPQNDIENRLAQIWKKVLHLSHVGRHDDFFTLGGNSLLAVALLTQIEKAFAQQLPLSSLFESATIDAQAELLRSPQNQESAASAWPSVVALQPKGSRPPLFFVHDIYDSFLSYRNLVRSLGDDQPVYGLQPVLAEESSTRTRNVEEMAALYARDMMGFQPQGAYFLCGFSFAGTVAFEIARQLEAQGKRVAFLALLDTGCPADSASFYEPTTRGQRQRNHRRIWRHLGARDRRIYFVHYAKERTTAIRRRFLGQRKTAEDRSSEEALKRVFTKSESFNRAASAAYVVQNYAGRISLFRGMLGCKSESSRDLGWKPFAAGGVELIEVSGDHATMLLPPHIHLLARRFRRRLRKAQQNERTTV
ncbi:MAG TPA: amino acid adenylation domain-containing protein, partial [Abditibacteriaceae bacterium]|nr:amino acid adenylation domain-containing protein [Abditibacteriaceae bacterium]